MHKHTKTQHNTTQHSQQNELKMSSDNFKHTIHNLSSLYLSMNAILSDLMCVNIEPELPMCGAMQSSQPQLFSD